MRLYPPRLILNMRSRRAAVSFGCLAFVLSFAVSAQADPIDWTGAQNINAASGKAVMSDDLTLTGHAAVNLFFGLEYLVVAGGGGGGGMSSVGGGGGGGGGGLRKYVEGEEDTNSESGLFAVSGTNYAVRVGAGGQGGSGSTGSNGQSSWFDAISSTGGGGGGFTGPSSGPGRDGGSGGGGGTQTSVGYAGGAGTADQGHSGGSSAGSSVSTSHRRGGGGGGAGDEGADGIENGKAGDGGPGLPTSITGTEVRLAGGGGGGTAGAAGTRGLGQDGGTDGATGNNTNHAADNTGGGGGGGGSSGSGANGGSGIVVLRYEGSEAAAGGTITYITEHAYGIAPAEYNAGTHGLIRYTVHAFTATGHHSFVAADLDLDRRLGATLSGNIDGDHGLTFEGPGTLTLSGNNSYAGGTTVAAGVLRVDNTAGSGTGNGAVQVAAGAALGGSGTIAGNVTFAEGAKFLFDPSATLTIGGAIVFEGTGENAFGVADLLVADWSLVPNRTYNLIDGAVDMNSLVNVGIDNAFDLEDGRLAYFQSGSLELVVIPEPGGLLLLSLSAVALMIRRRYTA